MRENSWLSYTEEDDKNVEVLAQEYKEFLSKCKTERECTQYFIKEAESHGYQDLNKLIAQGNRLKAGDKVYGCLLYTSHRRKYQQKIHSSS